ncbi:MAG: DUF3592 domain-containing protein [Polyangiaceae bacterium]
MAEKVTVPFAIVPFLFGFGLLLSSAIPLFFAFNPAMDSETTAAVSNIQGGFTQGGNSRCSVDAAFTVGGRTYTAHSLDASGANCKLALGDPLVVQYNAANPARNQIKSNSMPWLGGGLAVGGLLLLMLGIVLVLWPRRRR